MAQEKKNESVFAGVMRAIRRGRKDNTTVVNNRGIITGVPTPNAPFTSYQDKQQEFLDIQSSKIAQDLYSRSMYYEADRISSYQDYRSMDQSPEVSAALDIMADECVTKSEKGEILSIYTENSRVKNVLKDLFYNVLNINHNLGVWTRELIKFGDLFLRLEIDQKLGIYDVRELPVNEIHREESWDGQTNSARFRWETNNQYFEEWQVAHFRLISDTNRLPYGRSVLDPARKLWKQLQLAEDAMLVYRVVRAPERRVYFIEVGNIDPADVGQYIEKTKATIKKSPVVDQRTGNVNLKYNPITYEEDYFLPIRGDKSSRIETLPGASNLDAISDIEYLQNKLFAALKVPKPYLNYAESMPGGSALSQADLRFARTINRLQEFVVMELRRIANIHLFFLGFEDDIDNFTLSLTNPSTQQELLKLETMKARLEVFKEIFTTDVSSPVSYTWAMQNIMGFSEAEVKQILRQKKIERKMFAEIEQAAGEYKDTGIFAELDKKFRRPDFVPGQVPAEGGEAGAGAEAGAGGGSFGGGSSLTGGGMDMAGAGGEAGAGLGGEIGGENGTELGGEETGAETGTEAPPEETGTVSERNTLLNKNSILNNRTKKLLESMEKHFKKIDESESAEEGTPEIL